MFAYDLISNETPQVRITDKCGDVLYWMDENAVRQLPVFSANKFLGLVNQGVLQDLPEDQAVEYAYSTYINVMLPDDAHIFDILKLMTNASLSIVPIHNANGDYIGVVRHLDIIRMLGASAACKQPGALLELQMDQSDYSMSDIARIIEGNDAKILFSNIISDPKSRMINLVLKLNVTDISGVMQTFSRYGYKVKASGGDSEYEEDLRDRYDSLMNFINM